jgi:hypothetical protein
VRTARLANIRYAWVERLGVDADQVDAELEARFAALVAAVTDETPPRGSAEAAVAYGDLYTLGAFVTDARRVLSTEERSR